MTTPVDKNNEELILLKERASELGIKLTSKTTLDQLREMVNARLAPKVEETKEETIRRMKREIKLEAHKLIRVRVSCLNQTKKEFGGEWLAAGNSFVQTVSRFVPFDVETHIEQILLTHLLARKQAIVKNVKNAQGREDPLVNQRNEFQIEILPPLTAEELDKLRIDQSKRAAMS